MKARCGLEPGTNRSRALTTGLQSRRASSLRSGAQPGTRPEIRTRNILILSQADLPVFLAGQNQESLAGEERFELSISRFRAERFNPGLATPLHGGVKWLAKWMGVEPTWSS